MKKIFALLIFLLSSVKLIACSCEPPNQALEFFASKYVFIGTADSKVYSRDSLTYTITFKVLKHYKNGDLPRTLSFIVKSEGRYHGQFTSCDWGVEKNEQWLIYAHQGSGKLTFEYCSGNSRPLTLDNNLDPDSERLIAKSNGFEPSKYIFTRYQVGLTWFTLLSRVDSIFSKYRTKNSTANRLFMVVDIDERGKLFSSRLAYHPKDFTEITDSVFYFLIADIRESRKAANEAERDFLQLVRSVPKWPKLFVPNTNYPIKYRLHIQLTFTENVSKFHYF